MKEITKRWLNVKEAAAYIGIAKGSLYNMTSPKTRVYFPVKPKRVGKRVLFDIKELDAYLESI